MTMSRMGIMGSLRGSFLSRDAVIVPPGDWTRETDSGFKAGGATHVRIVYQVGM
jgi:hypothetical protein